MSFPTYRSVEEAQRQGDAYRAKVWAAIAEYRERCRRGDTSNPPFRSPGDDPGWFTNEEQP